MNQPATIQPRWTNNDQIIQSMSPLQTRKDSSTMDLDKSQPPTPDGSGFPANFQQIAPGLYRSSYPAYPHFESLRSHKLRTIITLVPTEIAPDYAKFISLEGIVHHQIPILANKDPDLFTDVETIHRVLDILLEPSNFPILIHCNKGRHRTGCMVACFRKVTGWTLDACIQEYVRYASPKERVLDKKFIERFDPSSLKSIAYGRGFVGGVYKQPTSFSEESTKSSVYTNNTAETYTSTEDDFPNVQYPDSIHRNSTETSDSLQSWPSN